MISTEDLVDIKYVASKMYFIVSTRPWHLTVSETNKATVFVG